MNSPEQALELIDQAVSVAKLSRAEHFAVLQAIRYIASLLKTNVPAQEKVGDINGN